MTTHYNGSRGPQEIASMPLRYANNALAKLKRERVDASRDGEIEALAAHIAEQSEAIVESQVVA